jgi:hypothetical protein
VIKELNYFIIVNRQWDLQKLSIIKLISSKQHKPKQTGRHNFDWSVTNLFQCTSSLDYVFFVPKLKKIVNVILNVNIWSVSNQKQKQKHCHHLQTVWCVIKPSERMHFRGQFEKLLNFNLQVTIFNYNYNHKLQLHGNSNHFYIHSNWKSRAEGYWRFLVSPR